MISSASIAAKIMGAINGRKYLFVFTLTVGFSMDTKVKGSRVVADEAVMVERLSRKCCSSASKSSSERLRRESQSHYESTVYIGARVMVTQLTATQLQLNTTTIMNLSDEHRKVPLHTA